MVESQIRIEVILIDGCSEPLKSSVLISFRARQYLTVWGFSTRRPQSDGGRPSCPRQTPWRGICASTHCVGCRRNGVCATIFNRIDRVVNKDTQSTVCDRSVLTLFVFRSERMHDIDHILSVTIVPTVLLTGVIRVVHSVRSEAHTRLASYGTNPTKERRRDP